MYDLREKPQLFEFCRFGKNIAEFNEMSAKADNINSVFNPHELAAIYGAIRPYRGEYITNVPVPCMDEFTNGQKQTIISLYSDKPWGQPVEMLSIGKIIYTKNYSSTQAYKAPPLYFCERPFGEDDPYYTNSWQNIIAHFRMNLATMYPSVIIDNVPTNAVSHLKLVPKGHE